MAKGWKRWGIAAVVLALLGVAAAVGVPRYLDQPHEEQRERQVDELRREPNVFRQIVVGYREGLLSDERVLEMTMEALEPRIEQAFALTIPLSPRTRPLSDRGAPLFLDGEVAIPTRGGVAVLPLDPGAPDHYDLLTLDGESGRGPIERLFIDGRDAHHPTVVHGGLALIADGDSGVIDVRERDVLWSRDGGHAPACLDDVHAVVTTSGSTVGIHDARDGHEIAVAAGTLLACGAGRVLLRGDDGVLLRGVGDDAEPVRLASIEDLPEEARGSEGWWVSAAGACWTDGERWLWLHPGAEPTRGTGRAIRFGDDGFVVHEGDGVEVRGASGEVEAERHVDELAIVAVGAGRIALGGQGGELWRPSDDDAEIFTDQPVDALGFDPTGTHLAWSGPTRAVQVVETEGLAVAREDLGPGIPGVIHVAPDGQSVLLQGRERLALRGPGFAPPVPTERVRPEPEPRYEVEELGPERVAVTVDGETHEVEVPRGARVVAASAGVVVVRDEDWVQVRRFDGPTLWRWEYEEEGFHTFYPPTDVALSPDGRHLAASGGGDQMAAAVTLYSVGERELTPIYTVEGGDGTFGAGRLHVRIHGFSAALPITAGDAVHDVCALAARDGQPIDGC